MLYLPVVFFCAMTVPEPECSHVTAHAVERPWVYRATLDECISFATEIAVRSDMADRYAKVYCIRAETYDQAHSEIIGLGR